MKLAKKYFEACAYYRYISALLVTHFGSVELLSNNCSCSFKLIVGTYILIKFKHTLNEI